MPVRFLGAGAFAFISLKGQKDERFQWALRSEGAIDDSRPQARSRDNDRKASGQCRRPLLHLESAWVQAAKLLAARLLGCKLQGCELQG
jgi:hypothetical protein